MTFPFAQLSRVFITTSTYPLTMALSYIPNLSKGATYQAISALGHQGHYF